MRISDWSSDVCSSDLPEGELRLTCSTAMGERFLAPLMRRFALQHPRLSVVVDLTNRLVDLVSEGYDLALRTGTLADARLIRTRIASRQFQKCAAPGYRPEGRGVGNERDSTCSYRGADDA